MTNPKGAYVHDTWHLFPCSHINWNTFTYSDTHYWYHLASEDLVSWRFMPLPKWVRPEAGNVIEANGIGMAFTNPRRKYISRDPDLADWAEAPRMIIPPVKPPVMDYFAFPYQNQWYMLGGHARFADNPEVPKLKLFRAKDASLDSWEYLGPFYHGNYEQGARTAHHPYIFFIGGKTVIGSGIPIEGGHQYLIGRIENERFIAEGRGAYGFAEQGPMTAQIWNANVNAGKRAVTWRWLQDSGMVRLVRDIVRDGWGTTNSLPREITLDAGNNALRFAPVREMQKLREGRLAKLHKADLAAGQADRLKTTGKTGQIEVVCQVKPGPESAAGILIEDAFGNPVRFYIDAAASELRLEYGQAQYDGSNLRVQTQRVPIQDPTRERELRLFFDRSVIEVYSEGVCSMARWYPSNPDQLLLSLFSEKGKASLKNLEAWRLGTIWKAYE
jgi:sucrose-6-phosphate hydrolase SacC (GH32 family)